MAKAVKATTARRGGRRTLGLLVDWLTEHYQNAVFVAVAEAAQEYDVNLICAAGGILNSPDPDWSQRNILYELVGAHNVDGLVVTAGTMGTLIGAENLARYLARYRPLPIVSTAFQLPGLPSVLVNNESGMRAVLEHLVVRHGHRRIAFVRGPEGNEEAQRRFAVYRAVLEDRNIVFDPAIVFKGNFDRRSGADAARHFLDAGVTFDALAAASDLMALGAMETFQARGLRIPRDLAVVGFDDVEDARFAFPPLTTARQPFRALGREAVGLALRQIGGQDVVDRVSLDTELVVRRSCGCVANEPTASRYPDSIDHGSPRVDVRSRFVASFRGLDVEGIDVDEAEASSLFDALSTDLEPGPAGAFAATLSDLIRAKGGDHLARWSEATASAFRSFGGSFADDPERRARVDTTGRDVRLLIADMAELVQGHNRMRLGALAVALSETSKALSATFDVASLVATLVRQLPQLGIRACFLALYERPLNPLTAATLRLAYDADRPLPAEVTGRAFETKQLTPDGVLFDDQRRTYVIEPLHFEREQLGFVTLQMGPREGLIYESLRDQISGALKGALLMARVVEEAKWRQAAEKEEAEKELRIAVRIQTMILPRTPVAPGLEISATMAPALSVGGDYYDVLPVEDGCWIGIGDVAGHGLVSGLIMLMMQSVVAGLIRQSANISPAEVVRSLNAVLFENVRSRLGQTEHATFSVVRYRPDGTMVIAGAHEDILVYRSKTGRCEIVPTPGTWLGMIANIDAETPETECHLDDGDVLLLYSDGLIEARDFHGKLYGQARLVEAFEKSAHLPVDVIRDQLIEGVRGWMSRQDDDITLLVARYRAMGKASR